MTPSSAQIEPGRRNSLIDVQSCQCDCLTFRAKWSVAVVSSAAWQRFFQSSASFRSAALALCSVADALVRMSASQNDLTSDLVAEMRAVAAGDQCSNRSERQGQAEDKKLLRGETKMV